MGELSFGRSKAGRGCLIEVAAYRVLIDHYFGTLTTYHVMEVRRLMEVQFYVVYSS